ncbi:cytochrome P450 [Streptomyces sp. NRRL B-1677]|nr:cytochrome P450 [Streptomyces sp. NRRL B-1677]
MAGDTARPYPAPELPGLDFDPFLAGALREGPAVRIRLPCGEGEAECWLVTRYEDVRFVTSDPRFSRQILGCPIPSMNRYLIPLDSAVSFVDPPDHTRVRTVVAPAFSALSAERLRPRAQVLMDGLLLSLEAQGPPADLIRHVISPFPLTLIGEILGIADEDRPQIRDWAQALLTRATSNEDVTHGRAIRASLHQFFSELAARRRAHPRTDLMTTMVTAVTDGRIAEEELLAIASLIAVNGWHAMRNNLANMVYTLLTHPQLMCQLRQHYLLTPTAVEELLRWIPHKNGIGQPRKATHDVHVGDTLIRAGEYVYVSYVAANWDSARYPQPERIDFHRQGPPHLAFGHGPHYCLGPHLARMEAAVLLSTLVGRFPHLRLAVPPSQVQWQARALIRGPVTLPAAW